MGYYFSFAHLCSRVVQYTKVTCVVFYDTTYTCWLPGFHVEGHIFIYIFNSKLAQSYINLTSMRVYVVTSDNLRMKKYTLKCK